MSQLCGSLDANALLRLILNDIPSQSAAVVALLNNYQGGFVVTDLAVVEVEYALRTHYGFSREQIADVLGSILHHPSIHNDLALLEKTFDLYVSHPKLSFTDCCLAIHAEVDNATPLWTFDQKLAGQSTENTQLIEV